MKNEIRSVVKSTPGPGAMLEPWTQPKLGNHDVMVKVQAASICGTDLQIFEWSNWVQDRVKPPFVMGHEFAGKIVETGKEVADLREGDFVSGETHIYCGKCFQCRTGNAHICERMLLRGVDTDGCFTEFHTLNEQTAWRNDRKLPIEAASAQEPLGNAVHVASAAEIPGKTVAVFGCGPIGSCLIGLCKSYGAAKIFAVDVVDYRLKLAHEMGADILINGKTENVIKNILGTTDNRGVDVFFEMSGAKPSFEQGFRTLRPGGSAILFGLPSNKVDIDVENWIIFKDARVRGIFGRRIWDTWYKTAEVLKTGEVDLSKIITHRFNLEEFQKAFALMKSGQCGKIIMYPNGRC